MKKIHTSHSFILLQTFYSFKNTKKEKEKLINDKKKGRQNQHGIIMQKYMNKRKPTKTSQNSKIQKFIKKTNKKSINSFIKLNNIQILKIPELLVNSNNKNVHSKNVETIEYLHPLILF